MVEPGADGFSDVTWTTYGAGAYGHLAAAVARHKRGDPLAPVTVLVPTNLCGIVARRRLAEGVGGRPGVAGLSVLTLDRLAERLASPALVGSGRRPTTAAVLAAAWRQTLAEEPGVFAPVAAHPATVRALVGAYRELREIDEAALSAIAEGGGAVARDLVSLHRRVVHRLSGQFYDVADLRQAAIAEVHRARPTELGGCVLFLPQDLRPGAVSLAVALASTVDLTVIAGTTGVARADDGVRTSVRRLTASAATVPTAPPFVAHTVLHASDSDDEVRCVVRTVASALRTVPAHRIAVLYGAGQPYARLLAEHLGAAGLTHNGAGVRPTIERTLPRLLLDLLALPDHGWRRDEVMALIARATVRTAEDRRLPAARWDRVSREAGVVAGDDWEIRLAAFAAEQRDTLPPDASDQWRRRNEFRAADADALREFVAGLRRHLDEGARLRAWPALSRWAAEAFALVAGDVDALRRLPEDEARAAAKLDQVIAGLAGLEALEGSAGLDALRGTVELELADDLPRYGVFGRGILVAPLSESIGLDMDVVFVVGLADDVVPGRLQPDALLSEEVRALAGGQLPPPTERLHRQHRQLLAAFAAAPERFASFPRGDLRRSTTRLPSRWLLPTLRANAGDATVDASGWHRLRGPFLIGSPSFASALGAAATLATEQEWRVRAAAAGAQRGEDPSTVLALDAVVAEALALARGRGSGAFTRYDGNLDGQTITPPAVTSATTLELYGRCPHAYFMQRLLGVNPVDAPEAILFVSPLVVGSIVHESLDEFHRQFGAMAGERWSPAQHAALRAIATAIAGVYTAHGQTGHPLLWERRLIRVLSHLDQLLDHDDEVRADTGRRQVRSELAFGTATDPPVTLGLPGGREVRLRGSADRVDLAGASIVVVDYKTGSDRAYADLSEVNPTANGTKLQLPVYAKAARAALGQPQTAVSAEYWFVETNRHVAVPLTAAVDARFTETIDVIVSGIAGGRFPHRPAPDDGYGGYIPCPYCDPDGMGAGEHRQEWLRKRDAPALAAYRAIVEPQAAS